jgi:hypothetical protein
LQKDQNNQAGTACIFLHPFCPRKVSPKDTVKKKILSRRGIASGEKGQQETAKERGRKRGQGTQAGEENGRKKAGQHGRCKAKNPFMQRVQ